MKLLMCEILKKKNQHNKTQTVIDTENKQVVDRREEDGLNYLRKIKRYSEFQQTLVDSKRQVA